VLALSRKLRKAVPDMRFIFLTSQPRQALPARLRELDPLIERTAGLHPLKVALAKALVTSDLAPHARPEPARYEPDCRR
jgi:hypothetical protein